MGKFISPPQPTFDFNPSFIPKTITRFLDQMTIAQSDNNNNNNKISKLEDLLSRLESEVNKIDAFKRELPLCMILMNHAIAALKEELMVFKKPVNRPVLEEFIPLKKTCDEDPKVEIDSSDKRNWLSSTQLWNTNQKVAEEQQNEMIDDHNNNNGSFVKEFIPFKGYSRFAVEDKEETHVSGLSLVTPGIKNPITANLFLNKIGADTTTTTTTNNNIKVASSDNIQIGRPQVQPPQLQTSRKQRRCWSTELHRRFVNALQQLGGSKVATPKQIRELMRVDGLTNDEVKSHLQKYRLHTKRFSCANESSNSSNVVSRGFWAQPCDLYVEKQLTSQSGSPDGPLLNCSTTGGDSMNDGEDEKSENNV